MSDQDELRGFDELRNRIAYILESHAHKAMDQQACAIIDEFGLTVSGDGCGYHEIYGSYDTRFGKWEEQ